MVRNKYEQLFVLHSFRDVKLASVGIVSTAEEWAAEAMCIFSESCFVRLEGVSMNVCDLFWCFSCCASYREHIKICSSPHNTQTGSVGSTAIHVRTFRASLFPIFWHSLQPTVIPVPCLNWNIQKACIQRSCGLFSSNHISFIVEVT